jgi:hypothetical protein
MRWTGCTAYRLMAAIYRGARFCISRFHPASGTATLKTEFAKCTARVRSATAEPQTNGHARSGVSLRGVRRNEPATNLSSSGPACCNVRSTILCKVGHNGPDSSIPFRVQSCASQWKFARNILERGIARNQLTFELSIFDGVQNLAKTRTRSIACRDQIIAVD